MVVAQLLRSLFLERIWPLEDGFRPLSQYKKGFKKQTIAITMNKIGYGLFLGTLLFPICSSGRSSPGETGLEERSFSNKKDYRADSQEVSPLTILHLGKEEFSPQEFQTLLDKLCEEKNLSKAVVYPLETVTDATVIPPSDLYLLVTERGCNTNIVSFLTNINKVAKKTSSPLLLWLNPEHYTMLKTQNSFERMVKKLQEKLSHRNNLFVTGLSSCFPLPSRLSLEDTPLKNTPLLLCPSQEEEAAQVVQLIQRRRNAYGGATIPLLTSINHSPRVNLQSLQSYEPFFKASSALKTLNHFFNDFLIFSKANAKSQTHRCNTSCGVSVGTSFVYKDCERSNNSKDLFRCLWEFSHEIVHGKKHTIPQRVRQSLEKKVIQFFGLKRDNKDRISPIIPDPGEYSLGTIDFKTFYTSLKSKNLKERNKYAVKKTSNAEIAQKKVSFFDKLTGKSREEIFLFLHKVILHYLFHHLENNIRELERSKEKSPQPKCKIVKEALYALNKHVAPFTIFADGDSSEKLPEEPKESLTKSTLFSRNSLPETIGDDGK